jgi:hypothetical protein
MAKSKKTTYLESLSKVAPAFAAKAAFGDLPKGALEYVTEAKLRKSKAGLGTLLMEGIKGRGGGRAIGAGIGITTAPIFLKGIDLLNSKDSSKQRLGLTLLGATAATYQGQRGFIEGYRSARVANLSKAEAARRGAVIGGTRVLYKTPAALLLGLSIAAGRKRSKKGDEASKYLIPALSGAAIGGVSRGVESVALDRLDLGSVGGRKTIMKSLKRALPAVGGGVAGGLLGGLVLSAAVDGAMKALKKEASIEKVALDPLTIAAGGKAAALGKAIVGMLAHGLPFVAGGHVASKAAMGYGRTGVALSKAPGGAKVVKGTNVLKTKQLAMGIREGLAGRKNPGWRAGISLGMVAPELKYNRQMGIEIGKLLRGVPPQYREKALLSAKKHITPTMQWSKRGEPIPVWNQLPDAIDMAVGKKSLFKGTGMSGAYNQLMHGGRGAYTQGGREVSRLPRAWAADKASNPLGPDLALLAGGVGLAGATAATGGLASIPLAMLGSHSLIGGIKGLGVRSSTIQKKALESSAQGIREAFLPGLKKPLSRKAIEHLMDIGISPASRDIGRQAGGAARRLAEGMRSYAKGGALKQLNRAVSPKRLTFSDAAVGPMLAGGGFAGLSQAFRSKKETG